MTASLWTWVQTTGLATRIHDSLMLTAALSAFHVVGMTLLAGSVLVSSLRLLGVLFPDRPIMDVISTTRTATLVGLAISIATGVLLFAPRATAASGNSIFRAKMLLLLVATSFQFLVSRPIALQTDAARGIARMIGAFSLVIWLAVVGAGAAFILLE